jgi:hypothetical protein
MANGAAGCVLSSLALNCVVLSHHYNARMIVQCFSSGWRVATHRQAGMVVQGLVSQLS